MSTTKNEDPDAFAHSHAYLSVRRFVRNNTPFLIAPWTAVKRLAWSIRYPTAASRFARIHETNYWANGESLSGEGSTMEATQHVREALEDFIREKQIPSMLDVPCGDFNWMRHVKMDIPYIGGDIVEAIALRNQANYGNERRKFQMIDLTKSKLPQCGLVFTRDCLNHLSIPDIQRAIANIKSSGADYIGVTQFPAQTVNKSQESGFTYRELNFRLAPFNWSEPVAIHDEKLHPGKHIAFWKTSDLPSAT
ncbi:MAG: class I SAM-dependent methyltransferase [Alphaproteobacteria bacterium]|nr:MAG: class I SAM-dependent methyltransferase [Alphaproteobacteria bacterium]